MEVSDSVWRSPCHARDSARAEISDNVVRVGVLNDISGIFQDTNGMGSVEAARMAAEDFNGGGKNIKVEIVYADHQNKADVGSAIARKWLEVDKVDAIVDVPNSAVGLTINSLLRDTKNDVPGIVHRQLRSHRQGLLAEHHPMGQRRLGDRQHHGGGDDGARRQGLVLPHGELRARPGHRGRGHQLHREERRQGAGLEQASARHAGLRLVPAAGAELEGQGDRARQCRRRHRQRSEAGRRVRHPGQRPDHGGVPAVRQRRARHGAEGGAGLQLLEAFYWDMDDDTRAFAKRFAARPGMNGKMPSGNQAGVYASTLAYLNAVAATGSDDAKDVVPQMKKFKGKDKLFGDVTIRQDGRVIHPMYLFEVKKPEDRNIPYDYYKLVSTIPAEQAFRPIADGGCSLVK